MFSVKRTSQKGFSLVELMVVVAIIGVLASIAVPQVSKFIAKARQAEAKTNLSSYYTAQKAFQAEYTIFDGRFGAIGYAPEGNLRYNTGVATSSSTAGATNGFTSSVSPTTAGLNTVTFCPASGTCTMLNGANGAAPANVTGATVSANAFTARALSVLMGTTADVWSINERKLITHVTNGIP